MTTVERTTIERTTTGRRPAGTAAPPTESAALAELSAGELWSAVRRAAATAPTAGPDTSTGRESVADRRVAPDRRVAAARLITERCVLDGVPRLGWVTPAAWPEVARTVAAVRAGLTGRADHAGPWPGGVLVLGTGGWSFAAQAVAELPTRQRDLRVLDDLRPQAIRAAVGHRSDHAPSAYLAISASGGTLETSHLARVTPALTGRTDRPVVWLRDRAGPGAFPLAPGGDPEHVAMLGAPLSTGFLVPAALTAPDQLPAAYGDLLRDHRSLGARAAALAVRAPVTGTVRILLVPPRWAGDGLRRWLTQLGRQVLCGKSTTFRPWVDVATGPTRVEATDPGDADVVLDLDRHPVGLAGLMSAMYTAGVFVACLALRAGLRPVEHTNVTAYKRLLGVTSGQPAADTGRRDADGLGAAATGAALPQLAAAWLADRGGIHRLHVVAYGQVERLPSAATFAAATGRRCEVHTGPAWNHHSFQAVFPDPHTAVVVVDAGPGPAPDATDPLRATSQALHDVAAATHRSLAGRSLLVTVSATGTTRSDGDGHGHGHSHGDEHPTSDGG
ncbi:hypothetical protein O7632_16800 [Solwaraspora sp. WMMD406]|uniref:hypothetical protein n=1 Tax=Solwaraspora sp. WMMD406 TaxID=3016095 RepID=UPI0024162B95|nr:hypothetical protein [Solwaraspora sp. WMMD406]MDG4765743.1 hypothetical protein [Solwaraspora sp. WMMD406]